MTDDERLVIRGLSKAEIAHFADLVGIKPQIQSVRIEGKALVIVAEPGEHQLGEPLTLAAVWVLARHSKLSQKAAAVFDALLKSRQVLTETETSMMIHPDGQIDIVKREFVVKGAAVELFLKRAQLVAKGFEERNTFAPPILEPDASKKRLVATAKRDKSSSATETGRKQNAAAVKVSGEKKAPNKLASAGGSRSKIK